MINFSIILYSQSKLNLLLNYSGCPQNFILHDNQCYGFFVNKTQKLKYSDAKDRCQHTLGYSLASVFSREETNFLGNMTVQTNKEIGKSSFNFPWIGLHKNAYSPEGIINLNKNYSITIISLIIDLFT